MMIKPDGCKGCPMYQEGVGFVPDEIIPGATTFVLGQNPGEEEEAQGRPFVGKTGQEMMNVYFPAAALVRGENVSIGNVLRCRLWEWNPKTKRKEGTNNLPKGKVLGQAIQHCKQYLHIPKETKLIVSQGAVALKLVAPNQKLSVMDLRGFLVPGGYDAGESIEARVRWQEPQGGGVSDSLSEEERPSKSPRGRGKRNSGAPSKAKRATVGRGKRL